jgi:flagellum-specific peptidoglycan hydrolase FlgJ
MKTFILLFAFLFACTKTETITTKTETTTETPTEKTRYDDRGLPTDRDYLTRSEWKGNHITDKITKKKFKAWKEACISNFIKFFSQEAKKEQVVSGIPYQIVVAQAIIESGFGMSKLAKEGNNYFGIKWRGKGKYVIIADDDPDDRFQVYESVWWSLRGHSKVLYKYQKHIKGKHTVENYVDCLCGGRTLEESKRHVDRGGKTYATACYRNSKGGKESYAQKILRYIKYYDL